MKIVEYSKKGEIILKNKLIAHILVETNEGYVFIKRSEIKRGEKNVFPLYWDIPGGTVEPGETPQNAAIRECFEEIGVEVTIDKIIFENSEIDFDKQTIYTRLIYLGSLVSKEYCIKLDKEEHSEFYFEKNLRKIVNSEKKLVPYLYDIIKMITNEYS